MGVTSHLANLFWSNHSGRPLSVWASGSASESSMYSLGASFSSDSSTDWTRLSGARNTDPD